MDLGAGANTEGTGIRNSKYASQDAQERSSLPPTSPIVSLPATVPYSSSANTRAMLEGLQDIAEERVTPLVGSDDDMTNVDDGKSLDTSYSSDNSAIEEMLKEYRDMRDVIHDLRFLYTSHKTLKEVVHIMADGLDNFKSTIRRLEEDCDGLRLELHLLRGGHAFHTHVPTQKEMDTLAEVKAKATAIHSVPRPPTVDDTPLPAEDNRNVGSEAFTEVANKKKNRRKRGKKVPRDIGTADHDSSTPVGPSSTAVPQVPVVTGAAMYSQVLSGPPLHP